MSARTIRAILVGPDTSVEFPPPIGHVSRDVEMMKGALIFIGVKKENIIVLRNSDATLDRIMRCVHALVPTRSSGKRDDAILFFFSGYAGKSNLIGRIIGSPFAHESTSDESTTIQSLLGIFKEITKKSRCKILGDLFLAVRNVANIFYRPYFLIALLPTSTGTTCSWTPV